MVQVVSFKLLLREEDKWNPRGELFHNGQGPYLAPCQKGVAGDPSPIVRRDWKISYHIFASVMTTTQTGTDFFPLLSLKGTDLPGIQGDGICILIGASPNTQNCCSLGERKRANVGQARFHIFQKVTLPGTRGPNYLLVHLIPYKSTTAFFY